jgi:hypothetical protein
MQTLSAAYLQITKQWGDVIRVVIDVAPHDSESAAVLATAHKRHNRNLAHICRHLEDIGALRDVAGALEPVATRPRLRRGAAITGRAAGPELMLATSGRG